MGRRLKELKDLLLPALDVLWTCSWAAFQVRLPARKPVPRFEPPDEAVRAIEGRNLLSVAVLLDVVTEN